MELWGERFRRLRERRGLTQTALSAICQWRGNGTVSRLESRARPPHADTLAKIAAALGYPIAVVRGDAEPDDLGPQMSQGSIPITDQPPTDQESAIVTDPILSAVIDLWKDLSPRTRRKILNLASADTPTTETQRARGRGRGYPHGGGTARLHRHGGPPLHPWRGRSGHGRGGRRARSDGTEGWHTLILECSMWNTMASQAS